MSALVVRPVRRSDRPQWDVLWRGYNDFYERTVPKAVSDRTWRRFFDRGEPVRALVAEERGRLLGVVHYIFHRSTSIETRTCYLQDLFTAEDARGQGVGRALIEAVYARAKRAGARRVYWHTHRTNKTAMLLYDKVATDHGFVVYAKEL